MNDDEDMYCNPQQNMFLQQKLASKVHKPPLKSGKPALTPPKKPALKPIFKGKTPTPEREMNQLFKGGVVRPSNMRKVTPPKIVEPSVTALANESDSNITDFRAMLRPVPSPIKTEMENNVLKTEDSQPYRPSDLSMGASSENPIEQMPPETAPTVFSPPVPKRTSVLSNPSTGSQLASHDPLQQRDQVTPSSEGLPTRIVPPRRPLKPVGPRPRVPIESFPCEESCSLPCDDEMYLENEILSEPQLIDEEEYTDAENISQHIPSRQSTPQLISDCVEFETDDIYCDEEDIPDYPVSSTVISNLPQSSQPPPFPPPSGEEDPGEFEDIYEDPPDLENCSFSKPPSFKPNPTSFQPYTFQQPEYLEPEDDDIYEDGPDVTGYPADEPEDEDIYDELDNMDLASKYGSGSGSLGRPAAVPPAIPSPAPVRASPGDLPPPPPSNLPPPSNPPPIPSTTTPGKPKKKIFSKMFSRGKKKENCEQSPVDEVCQGEGDQEWIEDGIEFEEEEDDTYADF